MQCPKCGAIEPDGSVACQRCGARLLEEIPAMAATSQVNVGGEPYVESTWAEYGGMPGQVETPASGGTVTPPLSPVPGSYAPASNYPYAAGSQPTAAAPPPVLSPKRRAVSLHVAGILGVLALLLIFGSSFIGFRIGQSHPETAVTQTSPTSVTNSTPDASQLYRQVTAQKPTFVDTLLNAQSSSWAVFEKSKYGCEIKSDGLHVHISDTGHFTYCTSGRGKFSNFAFQVEMKIMSGEGGGIIFRGDTVADSYYYFHVYPDGGYRLRIEQNHQSNTEIAEGFISGFASGNGQKNTLTVIVLDSQIYLYNNQSLITTVRDSTYSTGYLGVSVSDLNQAAEVVYTNAQIWLL